MIGCAQPDQLRRLFLRFFGDDKLAMAEYFADSFREAELPMSAVQTYLIQHADNAEDALLNLDELISTQISTRLLPSQLRRIRI